MVVYTLKSSVGDQIIVFKINLVSLTYVKLFGHITTVILDLSNMDVHDAYFVVYYLLILPIQFRVLQTS